MVVRLERAGGGNVRVLDIDLNDPSLRVEVAVAEVARRDGRITGRAYSVPEWLEQTGAVAGINGGFFGETVAGDFKEILGLLQTSGRVRSVAPVHQARGSDTRYARAAVGFTGEGTPLIDWVTNRPGDDQRLRAHEAPEFKGAGQRWRVEQALGCGPRLIRGGKASVTYRGERLASPGRLPRTFLGYGGRKGAAERLVLCAADGMEFAECAEFLLDYFARQYQAPCHEALCLDGGASTQAAWREKGRVTASPDPGTTVPTAVLVHRR